MDSVKQFKNLSMYHGEPTYSGEYEFNSKMMQQFDNLSLSEFIKLVDSNR